MQSRRVPCPWAPDGRAGRRDALLYLCRLRARGGGRGRLGGATVGFTIVFHTILTGDPLSCVRSLIDVVKRQSVRRMVFPCGLVLAGALNSLIHGSFEPLPPTTLGDKQRASFIVLRLALGGVLIGLGSLACRGCVCEQWMLGIARFDMRALVIVLFNFIFGGLFASAFSGDEEWALNFEIEESANSFERIGVLSGCVFGLLILVVGGIFIARRHMDDTVVGRLKVFVDLVSGLAIGTGVVISGIVRPSKVVHFLDANSHEWDPSLDGAAPGAGNLASAGLLCSCLALCGARGFLDQRRRMSQRPGRCTIGRRGHAPHIDA